MSDDLSFEKLFTSASALSAGAQNEKLVSTLIQQLPRPSLPIDTIHFTLEVIDYRCIFLEIRNANQLSPLQIARRVYFGGQGRWLVGTVDGIITVVVKKSLVQNFHDWLPTYSEAAIQVSSYLECLWDDALCQVLQCSLVFELNRSFGWINIGNDISTLSVQDIVTTPSLCGHKNVAVITITPFQNSSVKVHMQVKRFFPVDVGEMLSNPHLSYNVTVLPHLVDAICTAGYSGREPPTHLRSSSGLAQYWEKHHGYHIPSECVTKTLNVVLPSSGMELVYPTVCVWRHKWSYLPHHTREFVPAIRERLNKELGFIKQIWSENPVQPATVNKAQLPLDEINIGIQPVIAQQERKRRRKN